MPSHVARLKIQRVLGDRRSRASIFQSIRCKSPVIKQSSVHSVYMPDKFEGAEDAFEECEEEAENLGA